jgi:hypothetical protein
MGVITRARAFVVFALSGLVACGGGGGGAAERTVSLRLTGTPPDATVTVDDQIVGSLAMVAAHGVALPPGKHRITVEARGYLPWDRMVEAEAAPLKLDVGLMPVPD